MALIAFCQLGLDKLAGGSLHDFGLKASGELGEQRLITQNVAGIDQGGADGDVAPRKLERLFNRAGGMADLEAEVPQEVEQVFYHALSPGRLLVGQHEQQIEVGGGCEQAPAEASGGNDRHAFCVGWVGGAIDVLAGIVEHQLNERVVEQRQALGAAAPVAIAFKLPRGRRARRAQELLQTLDHGRPRRRHRARHVDQALELAAELAHVEIGGRSDAVVHRGQAIREAARRHVTGDPSPPRP